MRKQFKNITCGLISFFVSRNNDVSGYWGIGKLYAQMLSFERNKIQMDLIQKTIDPATDIFDIMLSKYAKWITSQMAQNGMSEEMVQSAFLNLEGFARTTEQSSGKIVPSRMHCSAVITDDLGKVYQSERSVWCRAHNPNLELKSSRTY